MESIEIDIDGKKSLSVPTNTMGLDEMCLPGNFIKSADVVLKDGKRLIIKHPILIKRNGKWGIEKDRMEGR